MMINKIEIEKIINKTCNRLDVTLYNWRLTGTKNNHKLLIFITKNGGITINDCSKFSREVEDQLDMRDIIETKYTLEISSPGLERPLIIPKHFSGAIGEKVHIKFWDDKDNLKNITGELNSIDNNCVYLKNRKDEITVINLSKIKKAKTIFKWSKKK